MRIVSWNCNGKFSKSIEYLNELNADIYCIQECESPDRVAYDFDGAIFWEGFLSYKGLGTFVRKGIEAARLDWEPYGTCYFLPLRIADRLNLVNVWTQPGYVSEWYIYQQLHKDKFDAKTLLCGDFNSFEGNKKTAASFRTHENCVSQLEEVGLMQNKNSEPTFYFHYNIEKPFRLDYCFAPISLVSKVEVGSPDKWLEYSDHIPLVIDLVEQRGHQTQNFVKLPLILRNV